MSAQVLYLARDCDYAENRVVKHCVKCDSDDVLVVEAVRGGYGSGNVIPLLVKLELTDESAKHVLRSSVERSGPTFPVCRALIPPAGYAVFSTRLSQRYSLTGNEL